MLVQFLIVWLLCTVAFIIHPHPTAAQDTKSLMMNAVAGVLVAIALCIVPMVAQRFMQ